VSDYKEELSALVERIKQDGAKEERRRIAEKLRERSFCVYASTNECISDCVRHIEQWLGGEQK